MRTYIEDAWQSYRKAVVPPGASEVQVNETRQAFKAGAAVLFHTVMNALDEDAEPTTADIEFMGALQQEIDNIGLKLDRDLLGRVTH